jgi:hypothetical protein
MLLAANCRLQIEKEGFCGRCLPLWCGFKPHPSTFNMLLDEPLLGIFFAFSEDFGSVCVCHLVGVGVRKLASQDALKKACVHFYLFSWEPLFV